MKPMRRGQPALQALAIALCISGSLWAAPSINVLGASPWNEFAVSNTDRIWFQFERTTGTGEDETLIPMFLPAAGATFSIEKDGSPCAVADSTNCSGSDVSVFSTVTGTIHVLEDGEAAGTSVFTVTIVGSFGLTWTVQPTQNASITAIRTVPQPAITYPALVPSGQSGVVLDAGTSVATYEPSASAPPLTFTWVASPAVTMSSTSAVNPSFDAPTVTSDTDYLFTVTADDGVFTADTTATVTVGGRDKPVDAVLLLDTSGSMGWHRSGSTSDLAGGCCSRLASAKSAAKDFVNRLGLFDPDSRLAVAIFPGQPYPSTEYARPFTPATGLAVVSDYPTVVTDIGGEVPAACGDCSTIPAPGGTTGIPVNWNGTPTRSGLAQAQTMLTAATGDTRRIIILLSDGAWNTPPGDDPAAAGPIGDLVANQIHVYTVGMGTGTDNVNHTSLQDISIGTGVGTATDPIGFTTFNLGDTSESNLVPFFEKVLTDMVSLEFASDPSGKVALGKTTEHPVVISDHDELASFTVSWESSQADLLDFHVQTPDCTTLTPQVSGGGYKNLTVEGSLLRAPTSADGCDWRLVVSYPRSGASSAATLTYNYSVITRSSLNMNVRLDRDRIFTGDEPVIEVRLAEENRRLQGGKIEAVVRRPKSAIGDWHFDSLRFQRQIEDQLKTVPTEISGEPLSRVERKNVVLLHNLKLALPGILSEPTLKLNDEGRDGDRYPGDGIYAATLRDVSVPGVYEIRLAATGVARNGQPYRRERTIQKFVDMVANEEVTAKEGAIESFQRGPQPQPGVIRVSVTPFDAAGNYLGPGYENEIQITSSLGTPKGPVEDLLFGAYQRRFDLDNISEDPRIEIKVRGVTVYDGKFSDLRKAGYRWELSLHAGWTDPHGVFGDFFKGDWSLMADLGYRFTKSWSLELLVGEHSFSAPQVDLDIFQTSLNWKYSYPVGLFRLFTNGGAGYYDPDLGGSGFGWNLGAGMTYPLNERSSLDLSYNHHKMTEGAKVEFSTLHLGLRWAFSPRR